MEHRPERGKWTYKENEDGTLELVPFVEQPKPRLHTIVTDDIPEGLVSMITGETFYSRSRYLRHVKEHGYEVVGTDMKSWNPDNRKEKDEKYTKKLEEDVERSYYEVRDNMAPLTELDKERCKIIDRQHESGYFNEVNYDDGGNEYE